MPITDQNGQIPPSDGDERPWSMEMSDLGPVSGASSPDANGTRARRGSFDNGAVLIVGCPDQS